MVGEGSGDDRANSHATPVGVSEQGMGSNVNNRLSGHREMRDNVGEKDRTVEMV